MISVWNLSFGFIVLGLIACGGKNVGSSNVESFYKLPSTDNDTDAKMDTVQLTDVNKEGVIKCEGFDKNKNYVYSRLEFQNSQVILAYIGAIQGKYELFHHDISKKITNFKFSFGDDSALISINMAQADQPRKVLALGLRLADAPEHPEITSETFYAAQLAYLEPTTGLDLSRVRMTCDVFKFKK
jgi:hypothetical protein